MTSRWLAVFAVMVLGATAGLAEAQPGPPSNRAILEALARIEAAAAGIDGKLDAIHVAVIANETVCTGATSQCAGSGHTGAAAAADNHNPVAVIVFVTRNGQPVLNLQPSAFTFQQKFTPASAPGYGPCNDVVSGNSAPGDIVGCGPFTDSLFQDAGDGVYAFYVHPTHPGFTWHSGMYTFLVAVNDADTVGRGLGKLVIP